MSTDPSFPQDDAAPENVTDTNNSSESAANEPAPANVDDSSANHEDAPVAADPANDVGANAVAEAADAVTTPPGEAPAVEASADESTSEPVATEDESTEKRKVQLNPTATPEEARPVSSITGETSGPVYAGPIEVPAVSDEEIEAAVSATISGKSETAPAEFASSEQTEDSETPSVDASIDAAIEEAMSGAAATADDGEGAAQQVDPEDLEPGQKLTGVVQSISGDNVFLDFGMRLSGVVPLRQFGSAKPPEAGAEVEVLFEQINEAEGLIATRLPGGTTATTVSGSEWEYLSKGQMVECIVKKTNKGGLEVTVGSLRGFIPASQIEFGFVEDMESFVGRKLTAEITEVKPAKKNLVLSRRKVLNARRAEAQRELMEELKPDQVRSGTVKTIKDYGAFIDLGGTDGFLPISQISWIRIGHPSEVIAEGQQIDVKVLSIDREKNKISLGMRQLTQNPWKVAETKYEKGSTVTGRVTKTEAFGAFIELEPGVEGLVHISELDHRRVKKVTEVLNVGDMAEVQVLEVNPGKKRISLSVKALTAKPAPVEKEPEPEVPKYERVRKGPLKGGTGSPSKSGGGLFGNPKDFEGS